MTREERNGKNHFFGKVRRFSIATLIAELADAAKKTVESAAPSDKETVSLGIDVRVTLFASFYVLSIFLYHFPLCRIRPKTSAWPVALRR